MKKVREIHKKRLAVSEPLLSNKRERFLLRSVELCNIIRKEKKRDSLMVVRTIPIENVYVTRIHI